MKNNKKLTLRISLEKSIYKEYFFGYINTIKTTNYLLLVMILLIFIDLYNKDYTFSLIYSLLVILVALLFPLIKQLINYRNILLINGGNIPHYKYVFDDSKITFINENSPSKSETYQYEQIISIIETKRLYVMKLDNGLSIIINKDNNIDLILERCSKINNKKIVSARFCTIFRFICLVLAIISLFIII